MLPPHSIPIPIPGIPQGTCRLFPLALSDHRRAGKTASQPADQTANTRHVRHFICNFDATLEAKIEGSSGESRDPKLRVALPPVSGEGSALCLGT